MGIVGLVKEPENTPIRDIMRNSSDTIKLTRPRYV
jgi:hypothetical protein